VSRKRDTHGHAVSLDLYRRSPDLVAQLLSQAGLVVDARLREPEPEGFEKSQQAYLMARKPEKA
jgi:hypothetical protein